MAAVRVWLVVGLVGAGTAALKAAGPMLLERRELPKRFARLLGLMAPALLAALVAVQTFGGDERLVLDARALGVAAAVVAVLLKAPMVLAVGVAALVTALARLL